MGTPFIAEMRITAFNVAPKGWAFCNGQTMQISQNQAMFSIVGTVFGGDGRTTFALPDMRGRTPVHVGNGVTLGQSMGEISHTLTALETPLHNHLVLATNNAGTDLAPTNDYFANSNVQPYRTDNNTTLAPASVTTVGGGQAHNNMQPYLVVNFIIALQGIFPSRN